MSRNAPHVMTSRKVVSIVEGSGVTGALVPETGVYEVLHSAHRLPDVVTLLAGQKFPRCQACTEPVKFRLQHRLPSADKSLHFRVNLYQLPVLDRYGRAS